MPRLKALLLGPLANLDMPLEEIARDDETLDLVGAIEDTEDAHLAIPALDGQLAGIAHAAVYLKHAVHDAVRHIRAIELRHRGLVAVILPAIGEPGCPQRDPLRRLDLDRRIGNHPLNRLPVGQRLPKGDAVLGVLDGHLHHPLARPDRPRRDRPARRANPLHRRIESVANLAEDIFFGDAHILKDQRRWIPSPHGSYTFGTPPHLTVYQETRNAAVRPRLLIGDGEDHREVGLVAIG